MVVVGLVAVVVAVVSVSNCVVAGVWRWRRCFGCICGDVAIVFANQPAC